MRSDRDLVLAARNGDKEAFADLISARAGRLFAIAFRITRDVDRAEDTVQDALMVAWRDLHNLRDPERIDAWLCRLLVHVCLVETTRERRRVANLRLLPDESPAGPDQMASVFDRDLLERAFRQLPTDQRAILVLHHYASQSHAEIAEALGIPTGTARSRLHMAHRAMRAILEADARSNVKEVPA